MTNAPRTQDQPGRSEWRVPHLCPVNPRRAQRLRAAADWLDAGYVPADGGRTSADLRDFADLLDGQDRRG